jgi:hypothetical protein
MERQWQNKTEEEISAESRREMDKLTGFRILDRQAVSDDEVILRVFAKALAFAPQLVRRSLRPISELIRLNSLFRVKK